MSDAPCSACGSTTSTHAEATPGEPVAACRDLVSCAARVRAWSTARRAGDRMPWVALPGERLPPAPPLWARFHPDGPPELFKDTWRVPLKEVRAAGWVQVVDAEGRSR